MPASDKPDADSFEEYVRLEREYLRGRPNSNATINSLRRLRATAKEAFDWEDTRVDKNRKDILLTRMAIIRDIAVLDLLIQRLESSNAY